MKAGFIPYRITSFRQLNARTKWLTCDRPIRAKPGQFVMAWLPEAGEKPFSIAAMSPCSLLVVDVGPFSHALHRLSSGDRLWIKGPLGRGFLLDGERLLLAGGGYGAAPLLALAHQAREAGLAVRVCLGARSAADLLLVDAFQNLGCEALLVTEDGSRGEKGLVTGPVEAAISSGKVDCLYACGPSGMLSALAALCRQGRVNYQLSWEAHMRCGMGLCGSCEVPRDLDPALPVGWLACFDGPVFHKTWPDGS